MFKSRNGEGAFTGSDLAVVALMVKTEGKRRRKKNNSGLTTGGVNNTEKYLRAGPLPLPC